jgi:hypothetical protein
MHRPERWTVTGSERLPLPVRFGRPGRSSSGPTWTGWSPAGASSPCPVSGLLLSHFFLGLPRCAVPLPAQLAGGLGEVAPMVE